MIIKDSDGPIILNSDKDMYVLIGVQKAKRCGLLHSDVIIGPECLVSWKD